VARPLLKLLATAGYRVAKLLVPGLYAQDGMASIHDHSFMDDARFREAYARGLQAIDGEPDYAWHWRIHVALWATAHAARVPGDFVECGTNRGFQASAVMKALDWNRQDRTYWLLDTFSGIDERYLSDAERARGAMERNREKLGSGFYVSGVDQVKRNFAEWDRVRIVVGSVPETLAQVTASQVAYLHLDMNCAPPEVAAADHFWERLSPGGIVLLDDYGYYGFSPQKEAFDAFARRRDIAICSLPTGQGLILKPPR
jgi:hypothetical protein